MMIARSAELAELLKEWLFESDIARAASHPRGIGSASRAGSGPSSRFSPETASSAWDDVVEPPDHDDSLVVAASG
jgi:hypothetical protein